MDHAGDGVGGDLQLAAVIRYEAVELALDVRELGIHRGGEPLLHGGADLSVICLLYTSRCV